MPREIGKQKPRRDDSWDHVHIAVEADFRIYLQKTDGSNEGKGFKDTFGLNYACVLKQPFKLRDSLRLILNCKIFFVLDGMSLVNGELSLLRHNSTRHLPPIANLRFQSDRSLRTIGESALRPLDNSPQVG